MKIVFVVLFMGSILFVGACGSSRSEQPTPDERSPAPAAAAVDEAELPTCTIKKIETCEVESEGPGGTVYRCPHCGEEGCEDCADKGHGHECKGCGDTPCRCRMENPPPR